MVVGGNPPLFGAAPKPHEMGQAYAKVSVGDKEPQQTEKAAKGIAPTWGQSLLVDKAEEVLIEVWATVGTQERFLGEAAIKVPAEGALRATRFLQPNQAKARAKVCGQLAVEITAGPGDPVEDFEVFVFEPTW